MTRPKSRARAKVVASPATTAARVDAMVAMMREGAWERGRSAKALALEWGCSVGRAEELAAEAWRRVCAEADDAERARPTIAGHLSTALAEAHEARRLGEVAKLADVWSRVVGARAPERVEHAVVVQQYERMTAAERVAWLEERAARLLTEARRLREADPALVAPAEKSS